MFNSSTLINRTFFCEITCARSQVSFRVGVEGGKEERMATDKIDHPTPSLPAADYYSLRVVILVVELHYFAKSNLKRRLVFEQCLFLFLKEGRKKTTTHAEKRSVQIQTRVL